MTAGAAPLLALAAVLALVGLAVAHYERAATLGFVLLAVGRPEPSPADVVFAVVVIVAALTGRFDLARAPGTVVGLIGVFIALNLLTATRAVDFGVVPRFLAVTAYLCVFAVWLCGYVRGHLRARALVRCYVFAAVVSAAAGCLALLVPFPGHESLLIFGDRVRGFYKDANVFGPFLVPAALILLEEMVRPRLLRARRPAKALLLVVVVLGIVFSFSRASWINLTVGMAVTLAVIALRSGGARKAVASLATIAALAVPVAAIVAATGNEHFFQERTRLQTYDQQRFGTQSAGIRLAERHALGAGPGQFEVLETRSAHSTYVRTVVEEGVAGFVVLIAVFALTLALAVRNAVRGLDTYGIGSAALLGAWCGILVNSAVVDTLHWRHLWVVAALIWAGAMREPAWAPSPVRVRSESWGVAQPFTG